MKLESQLPRQSPWLYVAPLLTTMLLLLVYFLLSTGYIAQSGVTVRLPEGNARLSGFERAEVITLVSGSPLRLFFNGIPVSKEHLAEKLREKNIGQKNSALIMADQQVSHGQVMEISQIALDEHFEVAFATSPPASSSP